MLWDDGDETRTGREKRTRSTQPRVFAYTEILSNGF